MTTTPSLRPASSQPVLMPAASAPPGPSRCPPAPRPMTVVLACCVVSASAARSADRSSQAPMPVARLPPTLPLSPPRPPMSISGARHPVQAPFPVVCAVLRPSLSRIRARPGLVHPARWASAFSRATLTAISSCRGIPTDAGSLDTQASAHTPHVAPSCSRRSPHLPLAPIFDSVPPLRALVSSSSRLGGFCVFSFLPSLYFAVLQSPRLASIQILEKRTTTHIASPALQQPSFLAQV